MMDFSQSIQNTFTPLLTLKMWSHVKVAVGSVEIGLLRVKRGPRISPLLHRVLVAQGIALTAVSAISVTLCLSMINYCALLLCAQSSGLMLLV